MRRTPARDLIYKRITGEEPMNRAKNKTAARRLKKLLKTPAPWEGNQQSVTPPIWVALSDAKPGLNVMRNYSKVIPEYTVVKVTVSDSGGGKEVIVHTADFNRVHQSIAQDSSFQKIKE